MAVFQRFRPIFAAGIAAAMSGAAPAFSEEPVQSAKPNALPSAFTSDAGIVRVDDATLNSRGTGHPVRRPKGGRVVADNASDQTVTRFGVTTRETFRAPRATPSAMAPATASVSASIVTSRTIVSIGPAPPP